MLHQLADPFRILHVSLAAGNVAHVVRVEKPALKPILERLECRLPIHAGRLHPNQGHARLGQPPSELPQPTERRPERPDLLIKAATTSARDADGRHDIVTMHIKPCTSINHHIHCCSLPNDD
jgi:hypothetical protein